MKRDGCEEDIMKEGWKTRAIGRHLIDVPNDATLVESYRYDEDKVEPLSFLKCVT